jgi:hypothetical protein
MLQGELKSMQDADAGKAFAQSGLAGTSGTITGQ